MKTSKIAQADLPSRLPSTSPVGKGPRTGRGTAAAMLHAAGLTHAMAAVELTTSEGRRAMVKRQASGLLETSVRLGLEGVHGAAT
jgi:ribosomal protein L13E